MPSRLHIPPFSEDFSCGVEEKSGPDRPDIHLAIVLFLTDDTKLFMEFTTLIRYERYAEMATIAKLCVRGFRVFGYPDNLDSERCELPF